MEGIETTCKAGKNPAADAAGLATSGGGCRPAADAVEDRHGGYRPATDAAVTACGRCHRPTAGEITWPGVNGYEVCTDCWEAECSESWWAFHKGWMERIGKKVAGDE